MLASDTLSAIDAALSTPFGGCACDRRSSSIPMDGRTSGLVVSDRANRWDSIGRRCDVRVGKISFGKPDAEDLEQRHDVKGLIKALQYEKDWEVRWGAALALGRIKDKSATQDLIRALGDKDKHVRMAAIRALANIGSADVEKIAPFLNDDYEFVRCEAAWALGRTGDKRALGEMGDARAMEPLNQALNDTTVYVQEEAKKSLDKIKTKDTTWH
jgi:hypothetical protein